MHEKVIVLCVLCSNLILFFFLSGAPCDIDQIDSKLKNCKLKKTLCEYNSQKILEIIFLLSYAIEKHISVTSFLEEDDAGLRQNSKYENNYLFSFHRCTITLFNFINLTSLFLFHRKG